MTWTNERKSEENALQICKRNMIFNNFNDIETVMRKKHKCTLNALKQNIKR